MLRWFRQSRWISPRFGMMSTVVGMLLFISAAGWWKFHRDLYVEERDAIRKLNEAVGKFTVHRSAPNLPWTAVDDELANGIPWNAPLLPPIDRISFDSDVPREARDVVLALPRLTSFSRLNSSPGVSPVAFDFEGYLGRPLPELPPATLAYDAVDAPFPEGEPVDAAEADRVASAIREAWSRDLAPRRFLHFSSGRHVSGMAMGLSFGTHVHIVEPDRRFHFDFSDERRLNPERVIILSDGDCYDVENVIPTWRKQSRHTGMSVVQDDEVFRRYPQDDFPYLAVDFDGYRLVSQTISEMPEFRLERVERIDDVRYRVDFVPFAVPRPEGWDSVFSADPRVEEWTCVLRSDLDWAPEESRIVEALQRVPSMTPIKYVRRLVQRYGSERDPHLLTERHVMQGIEGLTGFVEGGRVHYRYARERDPEYAERIFDPLSLDPEPWPEPRKLPWLRWYRVTTFLAIVLGLYLLGRRLMRRMPSLIRDDRRELPDPGNVEADR